MLRQKMSSPTVFAVAPGVGRVEDPGTDLRADIDRHLLGGRHDDRRLAALLLCHGVGMGVDPPSRVTTRSVSDSAARLQLRTEVAVRLVLATVPPRRHCR